MNVVGLIILILALAGAVAIFVINRRLPPKQIPRHETGILAAPEICDRYLPLLLEGITACQVFLEKNPGFEGVDHTQRRLEELLELASDHKLQMSRFGMGLGRKFEWDGNEPISFRFKNAMLAIDDFHYKNLVLKDEKF